MVSVFVYRDVQDLSNWRWKTDNSANPPMPIDPRSRRPYRAEGQQEDFYAYVRSEPIPSIILSPEDGEVTDFINGLPNTENVQGGHVEGMRYFIRELRKKVSACLPEINAHDEPLCVFIHIGGERYATFSTRLGNVWKGLDDNNRRTFLCFAITRNGNGINDAWKSREENGILELPSTEEEVLEVLQNGCRGLGDHYREYYRNFANTTPKTPDDNIPNARNAVRFPDRRSSEFPHVTPANKEPPSDVLVVADDKPAAGKRKVKSPFLVWSEKAWDGVDIKTYDEVLGSEGDIGKMSHYVFIVLDHDGDLDMGTIQKLPPRTLRVDGCKYMARVASVDRKNLKRAKDASEFRLAVYNAWLNYLKNRRRVEPMRDTLRSIGQYVLLAIVLLELVAGFALSCWKCWWAQSLKSGLGFGVLGLAFILVMIGVLLASRGEDQSDR